MNIYSSNKRGEFASAHFSVRQHEHKPEDYFIYSHTWDCNGFYNHLQDCVTGKKAAINRAFELGAIGVDIVGTQHH